MRTITDLVVSNGSFTQTVVAGTTLWLQSKGTGEVIQVEVTAVDARYLVGIDKTTGATIAVTAETFEDTFTVTGVLGVGNITTDFSKAAKEVKEKFDEKVSELKENENVQKAVEVGEKAFKEGKKAISGVLGLAAEALQKASQQLNTKDIAATKEEKEDIEA